MLFADVIWCVNVQISILNVEKVVEAAEPVAVAVVAAVVVVVAVVVFYVEAVKTNVSDSSAWMQPRTTVVWKIQTSVQDSLVYSSIV